MFYYMCIHFLYPFTHDEHLIFFHILAIENNVTMNMEKQIPLWDPDFNFFRHKSRSGIAGSQGSSLFNILRNSILFLVVVTLIYIATPTVYKGSLFSHPCQHFSLVTRHINMLYSLNLFTETETTSLLQ